MSNQKEGKKASEVVTKLLFENSKPKGRGAAGSLYRLDIIAEWTILEECPFSKYINTRINQNFEKQDSGFLNENPGILVGKNRQCLFCK